jgi:flagellar basal body-associated protein FliL
MKSFFGMLIVLIVLVAVVGGGALLWYLSDTAEFTRKDAPSAPSAPSSLR